MSAQKWFAAALAVGAMAMGASPALALEKFTYGLNWLPEAEHCGIYEARETGLYTAAGLDVEIVPGGPGVNLPQLVAAGKVDAGMGTAAITLNMRNAGVP